MGQWLPLNTPTGPITAWRADPAIPPIGALVVVQEIFGVNSHIRSVVDKFAAHGYTTIAPAIFDHIERHVELGYDEDGVARGLELADLVGFDQAVQAVRAAAEQVASAGRVGVVGYCWGGTVAYLSCVRLGLPAVSYYGARTAQYLHEHPSEPLLLHFGEQDASIPPEVVRQHYDALPEAEIHVWPAGHGFNCEQRADYNETVASDALQRTLAFLHHHLR